MQSLDDTEVVHGVDLLSVKVLDLLSLLRLDESLDDSGTDMKVLVLSVFRLRIDDFATVAVDVGGKDVTVATDYATEVADLVSRMILDRLPFFTDGLADNLVH